MTTNIPTRIRYGDRYRPTDPDVYQARQALYEALTDEGKKAVDRLANQILRARPWRQLAEGGARELVLALMQFGVLEP